MSSSPCFYVTPKKERRQKKISFFLLLFFVPVYTQTRRKVLKARFWCVCEICIVYRNDDAERAI